MKQNYIYSFLFFFVSLSCFAQLPDFTLTVTATPETCPGNGTLAFTTSGTDPNANVVFSIYLLPDITDPISTTPSNSLSGLDAGTYRVIATQTLGNLSNSQQQDAVIQSQATPLIFNLTGTDAICGNNGFISVSVTGGNPVSYEIFSGPILFAPQATPSFSNLIAGTYSVRVIDACGQGIVRTFTILEPQLSPEALVISENDFATDQLASCSLISVRHFILPQGMYVAFPLTFTYTVFPPGGGQPLTVTKTVNGTPGIPTNVMEIITDVPYFESSYTYNLVITDVCGTEYIKNGNVINRPFSLQLQEVPANCSSKNLTMKYLNYRLPITVAFLAAPAGFNPSAYNAQHPTFSQTTGPIYGSPNNGIPPGSYTVQITDACGRTDVKTILIGNTLPTPAVNSFYFTCAQGAGININIPGTPIATVTIISAPTASTLTLPYNANSYIVNGSAAIRDILVPGNYTITLTDICNNSYTIQTTVPPLLNINLEISYLGGCGTNEGSVAIGHMFIKLESVIFNSGPAAYANGFPDDVSENIQMGSFEMGSLPSGIYQVSTRDDCDRIRNLTLFIGGYFGSTDVEITKNCTSFDLYFEHVNNNAVPNQGFYLQLLNEVTGEWTHPNTGVVYPENTTPNFTNSLILNNSALNTNITAIGHFRIFTPSYIYSSNPAEANTFCYHTIYEFDINTSTTINSALNFSCSEGLSDVLLEVTGNGPFDFQIIEKDGQPFEVDNDEDPLFTNLETGVYLFQIEDSCGNQTPLIHDVSVPFVFGVTPFLCEGQNSTLSVPNFSYLEYEWFKEGAENTILSTSATLNINPLNLGTNSGTYYVSISYPANEESCLNQMLSYTISAGDAPNSGNDDEVTLCTLPLTVNLNDYLSGDYDENGTWEQINPGGTLISNVWNIEGITNGTYSFKYIVNGFCGVTDEAIIAIEILVDMPDPQIAAIGPICAGETINLIIANPDSNYSYSWTGPNNFTSNEQNPSIQNATVGMSGTYTVTATRGNCQTTGSVEVIVNSLPDFYFANENIVICSGQNAEIEIRPTSTATIPYQFVWYFNNVEITGENTTTLEIDEPGTYSVVITYGDCSITKTIEVTQNTNLFEVGIKAECEDNHYMLSAFAINNSFNESTATYLWSGPNGFYGTAQFMDITGLESGIYSVSITNESGCSVRASIEIQKSNCRIPKGVSPNGDGQNDTWDLSGFDILKVKIFNRYGLEVYDINNYVNEWHGQSHNGKLLPTATYYYYIQFRNGEETTGWVYLNREE